MNEFQPNQGQPNPAQPSPGQPNPAQPNQAQQYQPAPPPQYQPPAGPAPDINKWNWGAFMYNIWWGIGNKSYLPLLCLIPLFNIVWIFVCGAKGNEWAWNAGNYRDPATFNAVQATWNRAGKVMFFVWLALVALYVILIVVTMAAGVSLYNNYYY